jgi:hypothetical protein
MLSALPVTLEEANMFVKMYHRHHGQVLGYKFCVGVQNGSGLCGVAICGRAVARGINQRTVIEATRVCTDGARNAASFLYSRCARIAREHGYEKIITYTLASEGGTSLLAAGWMPVEEVKGRSWTCPSRPRTDKHPTVDKIRWEKDLV